MLPTTDPEFWEQRYRENATKWDLGIAAPPFESLLASADAPAVGKAAVIGCGQGRDALLFAWVGFEVVGFDFAPSAIARARNLSESQGIDCSFLQRDIFDLPGEFPNYFDCVVEHTCFCAIRPEQRPDYVQVIRSILKPGGELIALFWAHGRPDGPPFGTTLEELKELFGPYFDMTELALADNSVESRRGDEYLARFQVL